MTSSVSTPPVEVGELDDIELYRMAEDFLDALLSAADVDTIGMSRWWDRAKAALETAAGSSDNWGQCVARAARKLQIEAPDERLSQAVTGLTAVLANQAVYRRWARLAERDALYIAALVRERRSQRRAKATTAKKPTTKKTTEEDECLPF